VWHTCRAGPPHLIAGHRADSPDEFDRRAAAADGGRAWHGGPARRRRTDAPPGRRDCAATHSGEPRASRQCRHADHPERRRQRRVSSRPRPPTEGSYDVDGRWQISARTSRLLDGTPGAHAVL